MTRSASRTTEVKVRGRGGDRAAALDDLDLTNGKPGVFIDR